MMTFQEYADQYESLVLPLKKPATVVTFSSHLRPLKKQIGHLPLNEITYHDLQSWFTNRSKAAQAKTIKNEWGTLRTLLNCARREGLIEGFPVPVLPKLKKVQQPWLTLAQMQKLIAGCTEVYKPFVALLCETGLRIGEAVGLQTGDIDFENNNLTVARSVFAGDVQDPKSASALRNFAISGQLCGLLRRCALSDSHSAYIFRTSRQTPWWPGEIRASYLDNLCTTQGIHPIGFHGFRRGNATLFASILGCPERILANRLGHSPKGMTLGLYAQNVDKADVPYVEQAEKMLYGEAA